jgi:hypothetical protein
LKKISTPEISVKNPLLILKLSWNKFSRSIEISVNKISLYQGLIPRKPNIFTLYPAPLGVMAAPSRSLSSRNLYLTLALALIFSGSKHLQSSPLLTNLTKPKNFTKIMLTAIPSKS